MLLPMAISAKGSGVLVSLNGFLERAMPILTPLGVVLGFLFSPLLSSLRTLVPWLFAVMTLSGALKLRFRELGAAVANPAPVGIFFFFSHILMPLTALALALLFNPHAPDTVAGFVLLFSIPTAGSGFIWVSIFHGDGALSLALILIESIIAPVVVPLTVSLLLGKSVALDMGGMALSLGIMVVLPTLIGVGTNELSRGRATLRLSPLLGPISKLCLMLVVSINSAAVAPQVDFRGSTVWSISVQAIVLGFVGFAMGWLGSRLGRLSRPQTGTLVFAVGMRNISAAATLAIVFFPPAAALPAILGMVFQQTIAALAGKLFIPRSTGPIGS